MCVYVLIACVLVVCSHCINLPFVRSHDVCVLIARVLIVCVCVCVIIE